VSFVCTGEIDIYCQARSVKAGDEVSLVFRADGDPPFTIKIRSPEGKVIVERVLRDLPTGKPQGGQPITFKAVTAGEYKIEIAELYGKDRGEGTLQVSD
jgi:hypothetical protein